METKLSTMAELKFSDLEFEQKEGHVRVQFLKNFHFDMQNEDLQRIGDFEIRKNSIFFACGEKSARSKFNIILDRGLCDLTHTITRKPSFYIHSRSGIPLIGSNSFGLIDRNTNIIEVKPLTGCNENCNYCSVDEGLRTKKTTDLVIEKDYLVSEFEKLVKFKGEEVMAYINSQGEPTLYGPMPQLIAGLKAVENVKWVVMNTNGSTMTEEYIDELAKAGLTRINLSLNAIDPKKAKIISGWGKYDIEHIKKMAKYAATKMQFLIAPVWLPGFNDDEIPKLVAFAKEIGANIGIQNFLYYKRGRNPTQSMSWEEFYNKLSVLEKEFDVNLTKLDLGDGFKLKMSKNLPKPFKKGQVVEAEIMLRGRYPNEKLAVAKDRNITVIGCTKASGKVRVKLTRSKHNVFAGSST